MELGRGSENMFAKRDLSKLNNGRHYTLYINDYILHFY